jgi:hypothetical protein
MSNVTKEKISENQKEMLQIIIRGTEMADASEGLLRILYLSEKSLSEFDNGPLETSGSKM